MGLFSGQTHKKSCWKAKFWQKKSKIAKFGLQKIKIRQNGLEKIVALMLLQQNVQKYRKSTYITQWLINE